MNSLMTGVENPFELFNGWGPEKVVHVADRRTSMQGVLVIDNSARGIGKGGTRMSPVLSTHEVARLARTMTWKWAALDLFFGGAKAGILGDPASPKKEGMLRAFARALRNEVPHEYVFGLDVGLSEAEAAIMVDELGDLSSSVGLPRELGGFPYDELGVTGYGVAEATEAAAQHCGIDLRGARVSVHGFGAVGSAATKRLVELGAVVVGVATADGSVLDPDGLDTEKLLAWRETSGDGWMPDCGLSVAPAEAALSVPCDILIPAFRQDTIESTQASEINAKLIVEGANLPTTSKARTVDQRTSPFTVDATAVFASNAQQR